MKHLQEVRIPEKIELWVDKVTCDLCGVKIDPKTHDAEEVEVRHRIGSTYPDGGYGTDLTVDMCGACFDSKLVPWLKEQGVNPVPVDWEW